MQQRRIARVLEAVAAQADGSVPERLCAAAAQSTESFGAGLTLDAGNGLLQTVATTTGGQDGERLQSDLGEGPAYTAHRIGTPVLVPDLTLDASWPAFGPAAVECGLGAIFAFPLRRGSVRLGALALYREAAGELGDEHHADALVYARFALDLFLALQSENPPEELDQLFDVGSSSTTEIHQASGIVSVQLGITVGSALAVLRAHAYAEGRSLRGVALDVVARRLRIDHDR